MGREGISGKKQMNAARLNHKRELDSEGRLFSVILPFCQRYGYAFLKLGILLILCTLQYNIIAQKFQVNPSAKNILLLHECKNAYCSHVLLMFYTFLN